MSSGAKSYSENTTAHGFQYITASKNRFIRYFWVLNVAVAFSICFVFISQTLEEGEQHPTITSIVEILIDDLPSPTISILVPKGLNKHAYETRMLNTLPACPSLSNDLREESSIPEPFLRINDKLSEDIRHAVTYQTNLIYIGSNPRMVFCNLRSYVGGQQLDSLCSAMESMAKTDRDQMWENLTARVDLNLLKVYLSRAMDFGLPTVQETSCLEHTASGVIRPILSENDCNVTTAIGDEIFPAALAKMVAPLIFKEIYGMNCSEE